MFFVSSNTEHSSGERTGIPALDVKYDISQFIRTLNFPSALFLQSCFFFENLIKRVQYQSAFFSILIFNFILYFVLVMNVWTCKWVLYKTDGQFEFHMPLFSKHKIPMVSSRDLGRVAGFAITYPDLFQGIYLSLVELCTRFFLSHFFATDNLS